jgi:hypothetical protein
MTEAVEVGNVAEAEESDDDDETAPAVGGRPAVRRIGRTAFVTSLVWVIFDRLIVYVQLFA